MIVPILLFIAIATVVGLAIKMRLDSRADVQVRVVEPSDIPVSVVTASDTAAAFETGSLVASGSGWILNPRSTFPLTVDGIDRTGADNLKRALDDLSQPNYQKVAALLPILVTSNLRCREIDECVAASRPRYLQELNRLKVASTDWHTASDLDREDLLIEFSTKAIECLDVRPICDLITLFECEPADATIDDALIDRFGFETVRFYLRHADKLDKVHLVPADHHDRPRFEALAERGLAVRGADIGLPMILERMTLKEMGELIADLQPPKFGRKAQAIAFLLNAPDINERLRASVNFRQLFQLRTLPSEFADLDLSHVATAWRYAEEVATLLEHTYTMGCFAAQNRNRYREAGAIGVAAWQVLSAKDRLTCPCCLRASEKLHPATQVPRVPLHIGCRCSLVPRFQGV